MDVFSHGLWGILAVGRQGAPWAAAVWGMAPDVIAFGPFIASSLIQRKLPQQRPEAHKVPEWVHTMYNCTHSLVIYGLIFASLILAGKKQAAMLSLAWPLHILMDIPTHSKAYFPTRFLYPLSNICFNGIPWSRPGVLATNFLLLLIAYLFYLFYLLKPA